MLKLDYGVPTDRSGVDIRFGISRGFFADEGLDVTVRVIFGGPEIAAAYDSGDLKIGELGTPPGITAMGHGARFKIIASGLPGRVGLFFMVDPNVDDWTDLRGMTLGSLSIGSCSYWYLREILTQHGLDPDKDVNIRGLGNDYPRQHDLFEQGQIAGLLSPEPNAAIGEDREIANVWGNVLTLADVPDLQWSIRVANNAFIEERPDIIRAFLHAARRSSEYLRDHTEEWIDFYSKLFDLRHSISARAVTRERPTLEFEGKIDRQGLERAIWLQHRLGAIPKVIGADEMLASAFIA